MNYLYIAIAILYVLYGLFQARGLIRIINKEWDVRKMSLSIMLYIICSLIWPLVAVLLHIIFTILKAKNKEIEKELEPLKAKVALKRAELEKKITEMGKRGIDVSTIKKMNSLLGEM